MRKEQHNLLLANLLVDPVCVIMQRILEERGIIQVYTELNKIKILFNSGETKSLFLRPEPHYQTIGPASCL